MKKKIGALFIAALLCAHFAAAEDFPEGLNPEAAFLARISGLFIIEDPTSIYNFDVYDEEVEFILDGSWETKLDGTLTVSFDGGTGILAAAPPVFSQIVDLSSWVFIDKTWYFESSFAEQFTKNSVAAGYIGNGDTAVKHVRIGNSGIAFPSVYPFVRIGGGLAIAPGIMGTFAGDTWQADTIIRYDTAAPGELVLSGMNEVTDEYASVTDFIQGKWFVLPDSAVTGLVSVYVQSDGGSVRDAQGRRWRELNASEFKVSGLEGLIELESETRESIAVVYQGNYGSGTNPGTSLTDFLQEARAYFSDDPGSHIPADGTPAVAARYLIDLDGTPALLVRERGYFSPFAVASRYRASSSTMEVVYRESGIRPRDLRVLDYDGLYAELTRSPAGNIRDPESRFPLVREFPNIYFPSFGGQKPDTDLSIRSRAYTPVSSISLGSEVIAGTVQVTRDGITDTGFSFDEKTGLLVLDRLPSNGETVRITWLDADPSERNATFTLAGGLQWNPSASLSLKTASALRWNISKTGYTDATEGSPGSFIVSSGLFYNGPELKASTAFAFEVSVSDTTGFYRIFGMDNAPVTLYPEKDWYVPTPEDFEPDLDAAAISPPTLPDVLLTAYRVPVDGTDGNSLPTITDSSVSGSVLALSCSLPAPESWASADILAGTLGNAIASNAKTVSIALRNAGSTNDFDIFLQLGAGSSSYFEDPATVRTWLLGPTPVASGNWTVRTVQLTDDDRAALSSGSNLRLIVRPKASAAPQQIRLYSGPIEITDSGFTAEVFPADSTTTLSTEETADPAPNPLAVAEMEIISRFNNAKINTVLKAAFAPDADTETITVSKTIPALPLGRYNSLSFFIYPETLPVSGSITVLLSRPVDGSSGTEKDAALKLIMECASLEPGRWQKITVDFAGGSVRRDGLALPSAGARIEKSDRTIEPTHISVVFTDWPVSASPYLVCLDEFHLEGTESENTVRNESAFDWKKTGAVLSVGKTALFSDPSFSVRALSSASDSLPRPVVSGTAQTGFTVLKIRAAGAVAASSANPRIADSIRHSVLIPVGPLSAGEKFTADFSGNSLRRENLIDLAGALGAGITTSVEQKGRNLERNAALRLAPSFPATRIGIFSLSADSTFFQSGLSPFTDIQNAAWSDLWKQSFSHSLSTGESDAQKRSGKTALRSRWAFPSLQETGFRPSGLSIDVEADSVYSSGASAALGSKVSFTLGLPFKMGLATLSPEWRRTAGQKRNSGPGGSYVSDTSFIGASLEDQNWLYTIPPFADLFDGDIPETIQGPYSRSFSNTYRVLWKRPSPGTLADLYLPSSLDTSVGRETETDASAANVRDNYTSWVKAGFSALNIAGTYGILHIFPWYEQDEFTQLYSWASKWGSSYFTWNVDTWHSAMLFFPGTGTFVAENAFHYESPSVAGTGELTRNTVRLIWKRPGLSSPVSLIVRRWTDLPLTTKREDSASWSVTAGEQKSAAFAYDHILKTGIGANGEVQLSLGTGFSRDASDITTLLFRFGISGKLMY